MQDGRLPPIAPLTARSVALNVLLGFSPPELPVRSLVRIGALFGIADRTTRVALTRMSADGDVTGHDGVYQLTERLLRRKSRLDEVLWPRMKEWDGGWEMAIVTSPARPRPERDALRRVMIEGRMAELREGVWLRPHNLLRALDVPKGDVREMVAKVPAPTDLAATLWDLPQWAAEARRLIDRLVVDVDLTEGFVVASEAMRHLLIDPRLPSALQPGGWPSDELHRRYVDFHTMIVQRMRDYGNDS